MRTIIGEEKMMVDLRSEQPTKMTPKSILVAYEAELQQSHEKEKKFTAYLIR